jgi:4a-hydroxytetrahydrobiopterin dehydratase
VAAATLSDMDEQNVEWISSRQFHEAVGTGDWRVLGEGACAYFRTGSFEGGARLLQGISELAGLGDHHPDADLRHQGVTMRLITITPDRFGLSQRDVELARQISAVARELSALADPSVVQTVQVSVDALVSAEVMPFWRAEARIAAALAAGGRLVSDEHAPAWWTLADAEGNEADVATAASRG